MEINDVLKTSNKFHPKSFNVLHEFVVIIWRVCYSSWGHQFEEEIKWETCMLLYLDYYIHLSLWCDDYKINIDYDVNFGMY